MAFLYPWFFFLLVAALVAFRAVPPARRSLVLLFFSCAFYLVEDPIHLPLLLCLTAWVYAVALRLGSGQGGRGRLALVATTALGLVAVLAAFKVAGTAFQAWRPTPWGSPLQAGMLLLAPLGMSYYVFKLVGYLLDVHWGRIKAEGSFFSLVLYASFFPQILSGPIHRSGDFLGQLGGAPLARPRPRPHCAASCSGF